MACIDRLICRQITTSKKFPEAVVYMTRSQQTVALLSWQNSTGKDPIHVVHIRPSSLFFNMDSSESPLTQFLRPFTPGSRLFGDEVTCITHSDFDSSDCFHLLCGSTTQEISQSNTMPILAIWVVFPIRAVFSDVKIKFEYAEFVEMQCSLGMKLAGGEGQSKMVI